jgi:hypothetical protein
MKKYTVLLILFISSKIFAQCEAILPFTEKSMEEIHDVYQFTFLHKIPQNKLDSLVLQVMYPNMVIDSNYYDWNSTYPRVVSLIDRINMLKITDAIGALQTKEAFLILNLNYILPFKMGDDMSPYTSFCSTINYYGGPMALNKYFLNKEIPITEKLAFPEFNNAVALKCIPLREKYFKGITYCKPLQGDTAALYEMNKINPAPFDSMVENIFNKYCNKNAKQKLYYSRDSITMEVFQLPYFVDAIWDDCVPQIISPQNASTHQLGVLFRLDNDRAIIRVYTIANSMLSGQKIIAKQFNADFVSRTRRKCENYDE